MFKILRSSLLALITLAFFSCQKEVDDTPVNPVTATGVFKAKVDRVQYTAVEANGTFLRGVMSVGARSADKKYFAILISDTVPGTYILDQNASHAILFIDSTEANKDDYTTNAGSDTTQGGGKVTITSIDKVNKIITGTFSVKVFRTQDSKQRIITEGSFRVPYTSGVAPAKSTDTFHVKIDGADWTGKSISGITNSGFMAITASDLTLSKIIGLQFPQSLKAGTYTFDATGANIGIYLPDGSTPSQADSGTLEILEYNTTSKRIRGNFSFKSIELLTTKSYQLTSGYFSVGYQ